METTSMNNNNEMNNAEIGERLKILEDDIAEIKDILNMQMGHNRDLTERRFRDTSEIIQGISYQDGGLDRGVYQTEVVVGATTSSRNG